MNYKLSKYIIIPDIAIDNFDNYLIYSTRSGASLSINSNTLEKLKNSYYDSLTDEMIEKLTKYKILIPNEEKEFDNIIETFNSSKITNTSLNLVIAPSQNCQLGCSYCGQIHKSKKLDKNLENKIISHIENKLNHKNYSHLDITWYGGEPLLGILAIKRISNSIIESCKTKNINFQASMITNGLNLNIKNFIDLTNLNIISYQITIDGLKKSHDKSRYTKDFKPTFDIIFNNIKNIVSHPLFIEKNVSISIRVNVHKNNIDEIEDFIIFLYDNALHDKIFLNFAPVHDWGNNDADEKIGISTELFSQHEINWYILMSDLGFKYINILPNPVNNTCMTTTDDAELIDATGDVSYCWEIPYTETFSSNDTFKIGNLTNNSLDYNKTLPLRDWFDDIKFERYNSSNCKKCIFLPLCGGSCPISWYKGKPACPSFKFTFEDRLIFQFMRENNNIFQS